jgi:death-on-curing protein
MKVPTWISVEACLALHELVIAESGGDAGLRDRARLESCLQRPVQMMAYGEATLEQMAAAYAMGLIQGHPFMDGNKRTALLISAAFLEVNGMVFDLPQSSAAKLIERLAEGAAGETDYVRAIIRTRRRKVDRQAKGTRKQRT